MRILSLTAGLIVLAGLLVAGTGCLPDAPGLEPDDKPAGKPADKPADQPAGGGAWGGIKGQVVFNGNAPQRVKVDVNKDQPHCLMKGPILDEKWVVNPKNKGVKWAVVWLTSDNNVRVPGKMPIHPDLAKSKNPEAYVDQPCCVYEPHVLAMRSDQTLIFKNSGEVAHNVKYEALAPNPSGNPIINPGASEKASGPVSYAWTPITLECNIHGWMKSYVRVYDHPYFCVTDDDGNFEIKDAPAGEWFLNVWHEEVGIKGAGKTTTVDGKKVTPAGQKVTIKAGETTKVEPIGLDKQ